MDGAQPDISSADAVMPRRLQVLQERGNLLDAKMLDRHLAGIAIFPSGELQKQFLGPKKHI